MGNVIDVRPDRYLREMREHGDKAKALAASGMSQVEFHSRCVDHVEFDRAQIECHLEYLEDHIQTLVRRLLRATRNAAYSMLEARHPGG